MGAPNANSSPSIANGKIFTGFSEGICCVSSPHSLTINPVFNDNIGSSFDPPPSSWSILFPNDTVVTVSSPSITYPQVQNGNYSIISIIWQGTEVVLEVPPSIFVASDTVWIPTIKCRLSTHMTITMSTSTSYIGFKVDISGGLVDYENTSLAGAMILMEYSVTGGEPWSIITADYTKADGSYSAVWMPSSTGNYLVRATWSGNATYPRTSATVNLAVMSFEEQYVFSVESNSTISELAFDMKNWKLSFTATGPNGTIGYVKVTVAKSLIADIADFRVYLDGKQRNFSITSTNGSWLLTFIYEHSAHEIVMDLDINIIPEFPTWTLMLLILVVLIAASAIHKRRQLKT